MIFTTKLLNKLKRTWIPISILCLGLNWSGVQLTVWSATAIANSSKMPLSEAFQHAFKEKITYLEKESCACVPCRFVEWKHEHDNQKCDDLFLSKYSLEGISDILPQHINPSYIDSYWLHEENNQLIPINSPPQSPPPESYV